MRTNPGELPLQREVEVIPVWVDDDPLEMDERFFPPSPKRHIEWVPHERWVTQWRPRPPFVCPIDCGHEERRAELLAGCTNSNLSDPPARLQS